MAVNVLCKLEASTNGTSPGSNIRTLPTAGTASALTSQSDRIDLKTATNILIIRYHSTRTSADDVTRTVHATRAGAACRCVCVFVSVCLCVFDVCMRLYVYGCERVCTCVYVFVCIAYVNK